MVFDEGQLTVPRCAVHLEVDARKSPCERCGGYACEACFGDTDEGLCAQCRTRVGEKLPWEASPEWSVLARLAATFTRVVPDPFETFRALRSKDLGAAVRFAALANVLSYGVPMLLCAPFIGVILAANPYGMFGRSSVLLVGVLTIVALPLVLAGMALAHSALVGLCYHFAARAAGGSAPWVASFRAAAYLNVLAPFSAASWYLGRVPVLGLIVTLGLFLATHTWQTVALAGHARGAHRIADGRAWAVALVPTAMTLLLLVGAVALLVTLVVAMGFSRSQGWY